MNITNRPKFSSRFRSLFGSLFSSGAIGRFVAATSRVKKRAWLWLAAAIVGLAVIGAGSVWWWYQVQLTPVDSTNTSKVLIKIETGSTPNNIADTLQEKGLIRSEAAFLWYTRFDGTQNFLQAGTYRLSPSESTPEIVNHLKNGTVDTFNLTFLPGATLAQNRQVLLAAGYSLQAVDQALSASYDSPLFAGKPVSADLEGYIYGETYTFGVDTTAQQVLEHVFDTYYQVIKDNDFEAKFKAHGLSLFQAITLASIVQREASGDDAAQIAQVFYSRLAIGMVLGSDVTYQYIADKLGLDRDPNLDSPYNTRRYAGLPPGPISVPGLNALQAVAAPAKGDYLYFLSGDDDITYFARTYAEHQSNITNHCHDKCKII